MGTAGTAHTDDSDVRKFTREPCGHDWRGPHPRRRRQIARWAVDTLGHEKTELTLLALERIRLPDAPPAIRVITGDVLDADVLGPAQPCLAPGRPGQRPGSPYPARDPHPAVGEATL